MANVALKKKIFIDIETSVSCRTRTSCLSPPPRPALQLHLQSISPSMKGQDQDAGRYGVFSQQLASKSRPDNKENVPEVGVEMHSVAIATEFPRRD